MTAPDPFAPYRELFLSSLPRATDRVTEAHGPLIREQAARLDEASIRPALLCLLTAEALGADAAKAMPGAAALASLAAMAAVFRDIAADGERGEGLASRWGMPLALNAGDGFFALAQAALLTSAGSYEAALLLRACELLDEASRGLAEALQTDEARPARRLFSAAPALGALFAVSTSEIVASLSAFGRSLAAGAADATSLQRLGQEARARLQTAATYISERGGA
jgi:hypothetical protein